MKNSQKGFIVPVLIMIIVLMLIGGGTYIYLQNNKITITPINQQNNEKISTTTVTSSIQPEITVVAQSLNGNFVGDNIFNTKDDTGKEWSINYKNAKFYYTNPQANPQIWPGNLADWVKTSKATLSPENNEGAPGAITIVGTIDGNGILNASSIKQHAQ